MRFVELRNNDCCAVVRAKQRKVLFDVVCCVVLAGFCTVDHATSSSFGATCRIDARFCLFASCDMMGGYKSEGSDFFLFESPHPCCNRFFRRPCASFGQTIFCFSRVFRFMKAYPVEGQAELIFDAIVKAIGNGLDANQMRKDCDALKEWAEGKTEDDVLQAMKGDDKR